MQPVSVEAFLERWLADHVVPNLEKTTTHDCAYALRRHVVPHIGRQTLADPRADQVQAPGCRTALDRGPPAPEDGRRHAGVHHGDPGRQGPDRGGGACLWYPARVARRHPRDIIDAR